MFVSLLNAGDGWNVACHTAEANETAAETVRGTYGSGVKWDVILWLVVFWWVGVILQNAKRTIY